MIRMGTTPVEVGQTQHLPEYPRKEIRWCGFRIRHETPHPHIEPVNQASKATHNMSWWQLSHHLIDNALELFPVALECRTDDLEKDRASVRRQKLVRATAQECLLRLAHGP